MKKKRIEISEDIEKKKEIWRKPERSKGQPHWKQGSTSMIVYIKREFKAHK